MEYDPKKKNHGLPHDPFTSLIVPRPIGWITTISAAGVVNLAPYSFFNAVSGRPPMVMFASYDRKHSITNAEATGEFVFNLATYDLREQMNLTSAHVPPEVSEPELAKLEMTPSRVVKPPRVKRSPIALECRYTQTVQMRGADGQQYPGLVAFGEVVNVYIDDSIIVDGMVDITRARPIARLGYMNYSVVDNVFTMMRPDPV
jgi:flavin reductase (DIM6/NTAB) family NADH-FMN oxidoreductase RutF